jgi:hypothetical protein
MAVPGQQNKEERSKMKTLKIVLTVWVVLLIPAFCWAGSTICTADPPQQWGSMFVQRVAWTASSVDGNFTNCDLTYSVNGILAWVETIPGSPSPTASYYPVLTTATGLQITTAARSATAKEITKPTVSGSVQMTPVKGKLLLSLSGNSATSAKGVLNLYWFGD